MSPLLHLPFEVGYTKGGFESSGYNPTIATFVPVGGKSQKVKLGDIVPNDSFVNSTIRFIDGTGAAAKITDPDFGKKMNRTYIYIREDEAEDGAGWYYQQGDDDYEYNQNGVEIDFGTGFMVYRGGSEAAADLTYSGEVKKGPTTVNFPNSGYNNEGNCNPAPIKIGDITPNSTFVNSTIRFLDGTGAAAKITDPDFGKKMNRTYIYIRDDEAEDGAGWYYQQGDDDYEYNQNEKVTIDPNVGFMVYRGGSEGAAELQLPAVLPAAE